MLQSDPLFLFSQANIYFGAPQHFEESPQNELEEYEFHMQFDISPHKMKTGLFINWELSSEVEDFE